MQQGAADENGKLSFPYTPRLSDFGTTKAYSYSRYMIIDNHNDAYSVVVTADVGVVAAIYSSGKQLAVQILQTAGNSEERCFLAFAAVPEADTIKVSLQLDNWTPVEESLIQVIT